MERDRDVDLCLSLLKAIGEGRIDDGLVTRDLLIWTLATGDQTRAEYAARLAQMSQITAGPMVFEPIGVTVQGDRIAIEARSVANLRAGGVYENAYHFLFVVEGGRVSELRAYLNTATARDVLHPLFAALPQ